MKKRKILICHYVPNIISGAERAILDMVLPLQEIFEFTMFVPEEGILSEFYREKGLNVHVQSLSNRRKKFPGLHTFHSLLFSRYLRKSQYDLILCNTFFAANKVTTAAKLAKIPMVIFVREYIDINLPVYKQYIENSLALFGVSQDVADYLKPAHKRVYTVHDYLDTSAIAKVDKNKQTLNSTAPKVALIGRITPYKQQDLFVKSFSQVQKKISNVEFYIIGEASEKEQKFKIDLMDEAGRISKNIIFLGNRNDVYELLPQFSVSCMVSDREPFPRTILESQYLKVPVVASNSGGAKEMIEDGASGLFFDVSKKEPSLLAEKIISILDDEVLATEISNTAHKNLMRSFATQAPIENFQNILNDLIGESTWK